MRPMKAEDVSERLSELRYPLLASPKLDGLRALTMMIGGRVQLVSYTLKPFPNRWVQEVAESMPEGLDGEIIVGAPNGASAYRDTLSAVMAVAGQPKFNQWVFDYWGNPEEPYLVRQMHAEKLVRTHPSLAKLMHLMIDNEADLLEYEQQVLNEGYEGLMLRDPKGVYKHGRSTVREGALLKLKRFADAEAVVLGFEEQMKNTNEAKRDALGQMDRSTSKAGLMGKDTLGALIVRGVNGPYKGVEFAIGTGFNDIQRKRIWKARKLWAGKHVKYRYFPSGSKVAPRFPVYIGERVEQDLEI